MRSKDLNKTLNSSKKSSKTHVAAADDTITDFYNPLVKEIHEVFQITSIFCSDAMRFSSRFTTDPAIRAREIEFYILAFKEAFGVDVTEETLSLTYKEFIPLINLKRTVHSRTYQAPPFLGILSIIDEMQDHWNINHFNALKNQVDEWTGMMLGKNSEEGKKLIAALKNSEYDLYFKQVYGADPKTHWIISTLEGDKILCQNINEVACWISSRARRYSFDAQNLRKENW